MSKGVVVREIEAHLACEFEARELERFVETAYLRGVLAGAAMERAQREENEAQEMCEMYVRADREACEMHERETREARELERKGKLDQLLATLGSEP